jgi:hypothetical protein
MKPMKPSIRRVLLVVLLAFAPALPALAADDGAVPAAPAVSEQEALAAWQRFKAAPVERLEDATVFLRYMQGGAVHTVLNSNLVFWMYSDYPREAQAVLYAAYMGGNLESQLVTRKQGDDPEAAISAALDAYTALKRRDDALTIKRFDDMLVARAEGRLAEAVADLAQGKP